MSNRELELSYTAAGNVKLPNYLGEYFGSFFKIWTFSYNMI